MEMMYYANKEIPAMGDHVRNVRTGKLGTVYHVDLGPGNTPGHAQVSVNWDDGSVGVGMALAEEYELIARAKP